MMKPEKQQKQINKIHNIFFDKTKVIKDNLLDTLKPVNDFEFLYHEILPENYKQLYREPLHIIIHKIKEQEPDTYQEIENKLLIWVKKILKEKYKYERIPFTEENKEPNIIGYSTIIFLLQNNKRSKNIYNYKTHITTIAEAISNQKFKKLIPIEQLLEKLAYDRADKISIKEYDNETILENIIKILPNINKKEIINRIYKKWINDIKNNNTIYINNYIQSILHILGETDWLFEIKDFRTIKEYLPEDIEDVYLFAKKYNFIHKNQFTIKDITDWSLEESIILLSNFLPDNPQEKDKEHINNIIDYIQQQEENILPKTIKNHQIIIELLDQKCFSLEKIDNRFQRRTKINKIYEDDGIPVRVHNYETYDLFFLIERTMKYDHTKDDFIDNVYKEQRDYKQIVDFLRYPKLYEYRNLREKKKTFEIDKIQDDIFLWLLRNNITKVLPTLPKELENINQENKKIYEKFQNISENLITIITYWYDYSDEFIKIVKDPNTTTEDVHNYIFENVLEYDTTRLLNPDSTKGLTINQDFQQILTKIATLFPSWYYDSKSCWRTIYTEEDGKSIWYTLRDILKSPNEAITLLLKESLIYQDPKFAISTFSETNKKLNFTKSEILKLYMAGIQERIWENNPWFPINKENLLEYLDDNDVILNIEKDRNLITNPKPWTKQRFLENPERKNYLNKDIIATFQKFGTNIALAILEGTKNKEHFNQFYQEKFKEINKKNERSTILQLWEVFSLIIAKNNYQFLDSLVEQEVPLGKTIQNFIEQNTIGEKWKTIATLLFSSELNKSYQSWLDIDVDNICKNVYNKLISYQNTINIYKNIPGELKTSIWVEYEVTKSIASWYQERTKSDYKSDIEILSTYSGIAKWSDAIHEIATRPSDNPYLILLELKLLHELDFVDLNFEHEDYNKWSRSYHATVWWKYGIKYNETANLIQNTLIMSNLWGINAGKEVIKVNRYSNIRDKWTDCEAIFWEKTPTTEFRSLAIDTTESFERTLLSLFNLWIGKQAIDKYTNINQKNIINIPTQNITEYKEYLLEKKLIKEKINDEKTREIIYEFGKFWKQTIQSTENHNENFYDQETSWYLDERWIRIDNFLENRQNKEMFDDIVWWTTTNNPKEYIQEKSFIKSEELYSIVTPDLINKMTFINNLYLKPPTWNVSSINAENVLETTKEENQYRIYNEQDKQAMRKTIFDHIDEWSSPRKGIYYIQWSSDKMLVNQIQQSILDYNENIKKILKNQ